MLFFTVQKRRELETHYDQLLDLGLRSFQIQFYKGQLKVVNRKRNNEELTGMRPLSNGVKKLTK